MKIEQPLISVIIPTLNRSKMLIKALESVSLQSYTNIEIIVVDDNSDVPVTIDNSVFHTPVFIHRNQNRLGGAASRNIGVKNANGKYISFLDDDDYYFPDKIQYLYDKLISQPQLIGVFGYVEGSSHNSKYLKNDSVISNLKAVAGLHTNGSLIKTTEFKKIMFLDVLQKYQDTQLHIELIKTKKVKFYDFPVAFWNKDHGEGQITDLKNSDQYIKGIKAFYILNNYLKNKYSLTLSEQLYLLKNKIYLLSRCEKSLLDTNNITVSWCESILLHIAGLYVKAK